MEVWRSHWKSEMGFLMHCWTEEAEWGFLWCRCWQERKKNTYAIHNTIHFMLYIIHHFHYVCYYFLKAFTSTLISSTQVWISLPQSATILLMAAFFFLLLLPVWATSTDLKLVAFYHGRDYCCISRRNPCLSRVRSAGQMIRRRSLPSSCK